MELYNQLSQEQIETAKRFLKPFNAEEFLPQVLMNMMNDLNPGDVLVLMAAVGQSAYQKGIRDSAQAFNARLKGVK